METPFVTMILSAGWESKTILFILLVFSLATWTVVFNCVAFFRRAAGGNRRFRKRYGSAERLADLAKLETRHLQAPMGRLGKEAAVEAKRILGDLETHGGGDDQTFFLQSQFQVAAERLDGSFMSIVPSFDKGVIMLAMVSSLSPFLGLLGTVWGIMNSFFEIGKQGSASLPVVAPGIAEALISTLAGLAVAIPALFFYNYFTHRAERIETELEEFKGTLLGRLKRETIDAVIAAQRGTA